MVKRVTIKSIARDLGISHMTVSRALSGNQKVREQTRKVVLQRAEELGYIKNAAASTIRGETTAIVGILLPNLENEFYARLANHLAASPELEGLQLIIHLTNDDINKEQRAIVKLREIQAKAVVLVPAPGSVPAGRYLGDMPALQLIRTKELGVPSAAVLVDDAQAIVQAVQHLAGTGHTRIAYIGGDRSLSSGAGRLSAFLSGMQAAGVSPDPDTVLTSRPSFSMGYRSARELLDSGEVTALVCGGVEISNGALNACLERGLNITENLFFIGYGDPSYYRWLRGGISTIKLPTSRLARKIAELIAGLDSNRGQSSREHRLTAELVLRNSTK